MCEDCYLCAAKVAIAISVVTRSETTIYLAEKLGIISVEVGLNLRVGMPGTSNTMCEQKAP